MLGTPSNCSMTALKVSMKYVFVNNWPSSRVKSKGWFNHVECLLCVVAKLSHPLSMCTGKEDGLVVMRSL